MSNPQHHANQLDDFPASVQFEPESKPQRSYLRDDYDPEALIALLRQWRDEPSEDPEVAWAEFLELAKAIDEDRAPGRKLFEEYYAE
jgi:hypothetical protein